MAVDVVIPHDLWEEDAQTGARVIWVIRSGSRVQQGDLIAEILVEKITFELEAPASGILHAVVDDETVVNRGDRLAWIG